MFENLFSVFFFLLLTLTIMRYNITKSKFITNKLKFYEQNPSIRNAADNLTMVTSAKIDHQVQAVVPICYIL